MRKSHRLVQRRERKLDKLIGVKPLNREADPELKKVRKLMRRVNLKGKE